MTCRSRMANSFLVLCLTAFSHLIANGLQGNPRTVDDTAKPSHVGLPPNPSALSNGAINAAVSQPQPPASKPADDNENSTPTEWWMYAGQTSAEVDNTVRSHNARIINVKYDSFSPNPFTAVYVPNTGAYGRGWWWFYNLDEADLKKQLQTNNARLVSLKAYDNGQGQLRFIAAMIANTGPHAKGWWYYYGQSPEDIARLAKANNARLVSLQSYTWNGQTQYAVIMIANTGADQKGWWWWVNMSPGDVGKASTTNNARLLDMTYAGNGNFNVVMEACSGGCPKWWWWVGMDGNQVLAKAKQNDARIISVDTYPGCGSACFAAVMIGGSLGTDHGGIVHPLSLAGGSMTADDNENSTPTEWWMYAGQSPTEVDNTIHSHNARIVNIKYDSWSPYPFTAVYVPNTGAYGRGWWWWYGIDEATLQKYLHDNNARLVSLKAYEDGKGQLRFIAAMVANTGPYAKGWWYYYGQSPDDIARLVKANNARLVSLQSYTWNGQTKYAVIMIANTGADQKGWWWWVNMSPGDIGKASTTNNARLLDLTYAGNGNFNVVMESCSGGCPKWWWWFGMDGNQMLAKAKENNARIISVDTYPGCGDACFAAVMIGGSLGTDHGAIVHPLSPAGLRAANYRSQNGYSFVNSDAFQNMVGGYNWGELDDLYGCQVHVNLPFVGCTPIPDPFSFIYLGILDAAFQGGQCFGFSLSSLRFLNGQASLNSFPRVAGPEDIWDLVGVGFTNGQNVSPNLSKFIHEQHILQSSADAIHEYIVQRAGSTTPQDLMQKITNALNAQGAVLCMQNGGNGHCVVPYAVKPQANGDFTIENYNPNVPYSSGEDQASALAQSRITVHSATNSYQLGDGSEFSGGLTDIEVYPYSTFKSPAPPTSPEGLVHLIVGSVRGTAVKTAQISDASGHQLLDAKGAWNTNPGTRIPNSAVLPVFNGKAVPGTLLLALAEGGTYTHTIENHAPGKYQLDLVGRSFGVQLHDVPSNAGEKETISYGPSNSHFAFATTAASKPFDLQLHVRHADQSVRIAHVTGTANQNMRLEMGFDAAKETFSFQHQGNPGQVTIRLAYTLEKSSSEVTLAPVAVQHGDTITLKPNWKDLKGANPGTLEIKGANGAVKNRKIQ